MKRSFDQIADNTKLNLATSSASTLYNQSQKRRKIEQQRVGNFIVKVADALHFRIIDGEQKDDEGEQ